MEAEITARPEHVLVVPTGEFDVERGRAVLAEAIALAKAAGLERIVSDNRKLARPLFATEKSLLGAAAEALYGEHLAAGGRPLRIAFLVPEDWLLPFRPLADALNAIGLEAQTFDDPAKLTAWLGIEAI